MRRPLILVIPALCLLADCAAPPEAATAPPVRRGRAPRPIAGPVMPVGDVRVAAAPQDTTPPAIAEHVAPPTTPAPVRVGPLQPADEPAPVAPPEPLSREHAAVERDVAPVVEPAAAEPAPEAADEPAPEAIPEPAPEPVREAAPEPAPESAPEPAAGPAPAAVEPLPAAPEPGPVASAAIPAPVAAPTLAPSSFESAPATSAAAARHDTAPPAPIARQTPDSPPRPVAGGRGKLDELPEPPRRVRHEHHADHADHDHRDDSRGGWTIDAAVEAWLIGLDGHVDVGRGAASDAPPLSGDVDLGSDERELGLRLRGEARNGDWGVFMDVSRFSSETGTLPAAPGLGSDSDLTWTIVECGVAWRAATIRGCDGTNGSLDLIGGARWNSMDTRIDAVTAVGASRSRFDEDWVDPFIGARVRVPLGEGVALRARADIGGGFGSGSEHAWNGEVGIDWRIADRLTLFAGYRWHDMEREISDRASDLRFAGPGIGLTYRF